MKVWYGMANALLSRPNDLDEDGEDSNESEEMEIDEDSPKSQRRRVRSLRKKDLYAAWTAMMRTPRFVMRRRLRPKNASISGEGAADTPTQTIWPAPSEEKSGETVVWRSLMDLLADVAFKADGKRLGERYLHQYCGEFRHYIVEKSAYNIANREGGRSNVEVSSFWLWNMFALEFVLIYPLFHSTVACLYIDSRNLTRYTSTGAFPRKASCEATHVCSGIYLQ